MRRKTRKTVVGIFAFEVGSVMSKLVHLWESLSPKQVDRLRKYISDSAGLKELVSHDENFIQGLIPGELFEKMIHVTKFVARLGKQHCSDPRLKDFEHAVGDYIDNGIDPLGWELPREEMEKEANKMKRFIKIKSLYEGMNRLSELEHTLKDITSTLDGPISLDFQNKVELKRLEVEDLKKGSLWNMTLDYIGILLARSVFTIFSCIKSVYGVPQLKTDHTSTPSRSIFSKYKLLDASPDTLGAAALELHYANIVIQIENIVKYPCFLLSTRHSLYSMLPADMRAKLSERLHTIRSCTSSVLDVAAERKEEIGEILEWLAPLAHNTKKRHSKRNFLLTLYVSNSHVLLVQTLYFANQQKTEATIMELIVGMHYSLQAQIEPIQVMERLIIRRSRKAASLEDQEKGKSSISIAI